MKPLRYLALGLVLTGCAGFVDAIGFIELGGYYTSFMSGNTTQLGTGAVMATALLLPLGLVVMFFVGSFFGSLIALKSRRWGPSLVLAFVILTVAATLALSIAGFSAAQAMLVLAAGAGAQNATLPFSGGARLGTTFVSGTLFAAGQDLAGALAGNVPKLRWLQHLGVWAALLIGALAGALTHSQYDVFAAALPGAIYAAMAIGFLFRSPASG
jgi:uncharacterized membrane protein YoaK (UPF0700 family)